VGGGEAGGWSFTCRLRAVSDCVIEGGVREPLVGAVPLLASLDVSVERSVLKLALERLRSSLKFKKDGAIALVDGDSSSPLASIHRRKY